MTVPSVERMDPATRLVRSLPGKYLMVREAAEVLGVSHTTLRRLLKDEPEELGPSFCVYVGKNASPETGKGKIYLYTQEDLDKLRAFLSGPKRIWRNTDTPRQTGRPPKWTSEERKERQRLYSASYYYAQRAKKLAADGDPNGAVIAQSRVDEIQAQLNKEPTSA